MIPITKLWMIHDSFLANSMRCSGSASGAGIAMQIKTDKCAAYEVFALKQQKVVMKENPAYEEISPSYATIS